MANLRGTVHVRVAEKVTLDHLHAIIDQITNLSGCRACGLLGFELRLSGDPVEAVDILKLPGVKSATFGP